MTAPRIDYDRLSSEMVREVRGRRSQLAFSRRLGYGSNVAGAWESGRRWPTAARFLDGCRRVGIDLDQAVARLVVGRVEAMGPVDLTQPEGVATLLRECRSRQTVVALAERSGFSRHQVARWLSGSAEPRLPEFLRLLDATTLKVLDFVAGLMDPATLPSVSHRWSRMVAARVLARDTPWSSAVLLALDLDAYRLLPEHRAGWIARRLGVPLDVEEHCLGLLVAAGLAEQHGEKPLRSVRVEALDLRGTRPVRETKTFWSSVAVDRLRSGAPGLHSWNLFTCSRETLDRVEALQRSFYRELRATIESGDGGEEVALVVAHLVPLRDSEPG